MLKKGLGNIMKETKGSLLIQKKLNIKEIDPNATIETFGLDSLDVMEFLLETEEKYNISFNPEEVIDIKTVGSLIELLDKKIK
ncbi:MAG: acyl carrier protein [Bacillales bacterium]